MKNVGKGIRPENQRTNIKYTLKFKLEKKVTKKIIIVLNGIFNW